MLKTIYVTIIVLVATTSLFYLLRIFLFKTGLIYVTKRLWSSFKDLFHVYQTFKIPEFNSDSKGLATLSSSLQENSLYRQVSTYLHSLPSLEDSDFTNIFSGKKPNDVVLGLDPKQVIHDIFLGAKVRWIVEQETGGGSGSVSSRSFLLMVRKADKRRILSPYIQYIRATSEEIESRTNHNGGSSSSSRDLQLFLNVGVDGKNRDSSISMSKRWVSIPFRHPSTFETIVMESDLKSKLKLDLENFSKSKQYYHRLGRVWKRSYLLYGPSGTGKSSFIAAMANLLGYDVYDVDLSNVSDDSDLKVLLMQTTAKSVVVIEDLDRFLIAKSTDKSVSLSGILNFVDGLVTSCCAEERIMVFTVRGKDQIDPAVIRPGRVDVHVHFPLCDFGAFKSLANNYLGVRDHKLFPQVEEIFQSGATLSPSEIGELMMANRNSPSRALKSVINALQTEGDARSREAIGLSRNTNNIQSSSRRGQDDLSCDHSAVFSKEGVNTVKDFRKLYGLLRLKSTRKSLFSDTSPSIRDD